MYCPQQLHNVPEGMSTRQKVTTAHISLTTALTQTTMVEASIIAGNNMNNEARRGMYDNAQPPGCTSETK